MKSRTMHVIVTTAIALAVTGIARADSDDKKGKECSEATLQGLYVFSATASASSQVLLNRGRL